MLQCVAVICVAVCCSHMCCSVLQCAAVLCVAVRCSDLTVICAKRCMLLRNITQRVAVTYMTHHTCCSVLHSYVLQCVGQMCCGALQCNIASREAHASTFTLQSYVLQSCMLRVIFRKRATNYRALVRKMTYTDEASDVSSPPCNRMARGNCRLQPFAATRPDSQLISYGVLRHQT